MNTSKLSRRGMLAAAVLGLSNLVFAQPAGQPIRVGSTLALTGPLSATAQIHKPVSYTHLTLPTIYSV